jgi:hypothetical protein
VVYALKKEILLEPVEHITGDRQRDALICALRAVERREGERRGWDQHPQMWTLHLPNPASETVEVRPVPAEVWKNGCANPADDVAVAAKRIGRPPLQPVPTSFADTPEHVAGVVMMVESWGVPQDLLTEENKKAAAAGTRSIHTNAHRMELRSMVMADVNGHGYILTRVRGSEPEPPLLFTPKQMQAPSGEGPGKVGRAMLSLAWAARERGWPAGR